VQLLIPGVGILKPGTRIADVQVDSIRLRNLVIHAVEHVLFVAFIVQRDQFGGSRNRPLFRPFTPTKFPHFWFPYAKSIAPVDVPKLP
jgi:hypothetical protein